MNQHEDELRWIQGCQAGDGPSLERLVKEHFRMVLSIAHRFTGDATEAEDLCQEVFEKVVRGLRTFRGESRLKTWVYSIAVAHCVNYRKSRAFAFARRAQTLDSKDFQDHGRGPDRQLLKKETCMAVHQAVSSLPERFRSVVILSEFENLPGAEVARRLGVPEGTVWSRLNKARALLREKLLRYA